ncbi:hypothetical protein Y032_0331g2734 [Ancylostoma ceylanicum]|nr:hypothetical protein Y032_0331g2734 [Ancylostoma ceylanicum]
MDSHNIGLIQGGLRALRGSAWLQLSCVGVECDATVASLRPSRRNYYFALVAGAAILAVVLSCNAMVNLSGSNFALVVKDGWWFQDVLFLQPN